jgi:hypothetical protein
MPTLLRGRQHTSNRHHPWRWVRCVVMLAPDSVVGAGVLHAGLAAVHVACRM